MSCCSSWQHSPGCTWWMKAISCCTTGGPLCKPRLEVDKFSTPVIAHLSPYRAPWCVQASVVAASTWFMQATILQMLQVMLLHKILQGQNTTTTRICSPLAITICRYQLVYAVGDATVLPAREERLAVVQALLQALNQLVLQAAEKPDSFPELTAPGVARWNSRTARCVPCVHLLWVGW